MPDGEGYEFAVLGDHHADVADLIERVRAHAEREVGRLYLERARHRHGWAVTDDEVAGRLVWNDDHLSGTPYKVVVDGRMLTWEELGMALDSYDGWNFRLVISDGVQDGRPDAEPIDIPLHPEAAGDE